MEIWFFRGIIGFSGGISFFENFPRISGPSIPIRTVKNFCLFFQNFRDQSWNSNDTGNSYVIRLNLKNALSLIIWRSFFSHYYLDDWEKSHWILQFKELYSFHCYQYGIRDRFWMISISDWLWSGAHRHTNTHTHPSDSSLALGYLIVFRKLKFVCGCGRIRRLYVDDRCNTMCTSEWVRERGRVRSLYYGWVNVH